MSTKTRTIRPQTDVASFARKHGANSYATHSIERTANVPSALIVAAQTLATVNEDVSLYVTVRHDNGFVQEAEARDPGASGSVADAITFTPIADNGQPIVPYSVTVRTDQVLIATLIVGSYDIRYEA